MRFSVIKRGVLLSSIVERIQGKCDQDTNIEVFGVCSIEEPIADYISLFTGDSEIELKRILGNKSVRAILVKSSLKITELGSSIILIQVKDPVAALVKTMEFFLERTLPTSEISPLASVDPTSKLGKDVRVGAYAVIGENCKIGDSTTIYPHVVIYPQVTLGKRVTIHAGAVIREGCSIGDDVVIQNGAVVGADGFGYFFNGTKLEPVPQIGKVILENEVEIGANTCIDRATMGTTKIGAGTKLDNLVQVGHNVQIGSMSILCGQSGIGGSSKLGNGVTLGGQAGVADHTVIGDKIRFAGKAGAHGTFNTPGDYAGMPALPLAQWRRQMTALMKLPKFLVKLRDEEQT